MKLRKNDSKLNTVMKGFFQKDFYGHPCTVQYVFFFLESLRREPRKSIVSQVERKKREREEKEPFLLLFLSSLQEKGFSSLSCLPWFSSLSVRPPMSHSSSSSSFLLRPRLISLSPTKLGWVGLLLTALPSSSLPPTLLFHLLS